MTLQVYFTIARQEGQHNGQNSDSQSKDKWEELFFISFTKLNYIFHSKIF